MPTKIFTTLGGACPFGEGPEIDSLKCRNCEYYWRIGTGTFFWCLHPVQQQPAPEPEKRKRGRPKGSKNKKKVARRKIKPSAGHKDKKR